MNYSNTAARTPHGRLSRQHLVLFTRRSAAATSAWVRRASLRRAGLLAGVAAVALSGGLLAQNARTANPAQTRSSVGFARPSLAAAPLSPPLPSPSLSLPSSAGALLGADPAPSSLSLSSPSLAPSLVPITSAASLTRVASLPAVADVQFQVTATSALGEAGAAVADAVYLSRLHAQLQAPLAAPASSVDVAQLAELVRQAQVSTHPAVAAPAPVISSGAAPAVVPAPIISPVAAPAVVSAPIVAPVVLPVVPIVAPAVSSVATPSALALTPAIAPATVAAATSSSGASVLTPAIAPAIVAAATSSSGVAVPVTPAASAIGTPAASSPALTQTVPAVDPQALAQAQSDVRDAEAALLAGQDAADRATPSPSQAAAAAPAAIATAVTPLSPVATAVAPVAVAAAPTAPNPVDSAAFQQAKQNLAAAQQQLLVLTAPPPAAQVAVAQRAIADALAATPVAPSDADLQSAQDAVTQAKQLLADVSKPPSQQAIAKAQGSELDKLLRGPDPQQIAQAQTALTSAQNALATLQQNRTYAWNPESQPSVIQARAQLAQLTVPPDPAKLADAQAAVTAAQQRVDSLQPVAVVAVVPAATAAPAPVAATSVPSPTDAAAQPVTASAPPQAASSASAAAPAPDEVKAAEARLAAAQAHLRALVTASTAVPVAATPAPASAAPAPALPAATADPAQAPAVAAATADPAQAPAVAAATADPAPAAAAATPDALPATAPAPTPAAAGGDGVLAAPAEATASNETAPASGPDAAVAAGSTVTAPDDSAISADEAALAASGTAKSTALVASELGLQASFVEDALLQALHLHPSAFGAPPTSGASASAAVSPGQAVSFAWPASGPITQPFGVPELGVGLPHTGIDIGQNLGGPVLASAPGVVSFAGGDPSFSYGYYVIIDHGMGITTLYGHMALPPIVHVGQLVAQGSLLGLSGSTGFSTGPHVHFEVRIKGVPVDPLPLLEKGSSN